MFDVWGKDRILLLPTITQSGSKLQVFPVHMHVCMLSHVSCVWLCVTPWTAVHQAPLSMGLSRQEYWGGFPGPPSGDRPDPGIEPASLLSPILAGVFFSTSATWEAPFLFTLVRKLLELINYAI